MTKNLITSIDEDPIGAAEFYLRHLMDVGRFLRDLQDLEDDGTFEENTLDTLTDLIGEAEEGFKDLLGLNQEEFDAKFQDEAGWDAYYLELKTDQRGR